jgi:hypothetical protein
MPPAKGRRRMNAAKLGGFREGSAFDHGAGMVEPTVLLAQPRQRRLGQRVDGPAAAFAAEPRKTVRPSPGDGLPSRAVRTALSAHPLMAACSERVRPRAPLRIAGLRSLGRRTRPCPARARALLCALKPRQRHESRNALSRAQAPDARKPCRKVLSVHRIKTRSQPRPTPQSDPNQQLTL